MALTSKKSRLNRIPQLMNKMRDVNEMLRTERFSEHASFSLNDRIGVSTVFQEKKPLNFKRLD